MDGIVISDRYYSNSAWFNSDIQWSGIQFVANAEGRIYDWIMRNWTLKSETSTLVHHALQLGSAHNVATTIPLKRILRPLTTIHWWAICRFARSLVTSPLAVAFKDGALALSALQKSYPSRMAQRLGWVDLRGCFVSRHVSDWFSMF